MQYLDAQTDYIYGRIELDVCSLLMVNNRQWNSRDI